LRKAGVSRATFYRKMSGHPLAPQTTVEPDGSATFRRVEMDRFVKAIKRKEEV
jgi:predicted DNA-binding transcriptional regulator AlpA